jgi:hypothetical protein
LAARLTALAAAALAAGAVEADGLRFLDSARIADKAAGLSEPSGLALTADGRGFWTVSDDAPRVLFIGPDGRVDPSRSIAVGADDLEGVAEDPARGRLLAVSESAAEIVAVDLTDGAVTRHPLAAMAGWEAAPRALRDSDPRDGLEGIAVEAATGNVFVVKERAPRLLLELTPDLARIRGALPLDAARGFADEETGGRPAGRVGPRGRCGPRRALDRERYRRARLPARSRHAAGAELAAARWGRSQGEAHPQRRGRRVVDDGRELSVVTDDGKRSRLYRYAIEID